MTRRLAAASASVLTLSGCAATPALHSEPTALRAASPAPSSAGFAPDPATREATRPDANFDYGFVVQITVAGFRPRTLVSACCLAVTWRNLTPQSVSVVFDHQLVRSGAIPPGGTWVFVPHNAESITYHAGSSPDSTGALQVQQTFDS